MIGLLCKRIAIGFCDVLGTVENILVTQSFSKKIEAAVVQHQKEVAKSLQKRGNDSSA
jgi:hypothetical protein